MKWVVLVLLLVGCGGEGPPTPFVGDPTVPTFETEPTPPDSDAPDTIATPPPLEGPYCKLDANGNYASTAAPVAQQGLAGPNSFAIGGGCLSRPLREAWAVTHAGAGVKWKDADLTGFSHKTDPKVDFLFQSVNEAGPFFARQEWTMEWYHTATQGTVDKPDYVVIHYSKVKGTSHIEHWKGVIELKRLTDQITSVAIRNELRGTRINPKSAAGGLTDLYEHLKSGRPDWTYLSGL